MLKIDYTSYISSARNFRERFLVLHYTAINFADSVKALRKNVSAHYLVPTLNCIDSTYPNNELIVYSLVNENHRSWHAGVSSWQDRANINDSSIGVEIVNMATEAEFQPYPKEQVAIIIQLCKNILSRYPDITPTRVVGHSDIAIGRKMDPGALFPWQQLHDSGIGAWYDKDTFIKYQEKFSKDMPSITEVIAKLNAYGYNSNKISDKNTLKAFQMHFRGCKYDGSLDVETAAIAYALVEKYIK